MEDEVKFDYDLIVIGGGSGGLAAAKEAAKLDRSLKVAVFDYIQPTPHGTKWGLGGTCVNVGCIPKKLFHFSSSFHSKFEDAKSLGWAVDAKHTWADMVESVDNYIRGMNYSYKKALKTEKVTYINAFAKFVDERTVSYTLKGKTHNVTAATYIVACGGRPTYPDIPGAELALTSDDIFWRDQDPGKTLVVGASYIALECASFLNELGRDVTVMVRSILLRGFDQQCAEQVGEYMERIGVKFINPCVPNSIVKLEDGKLEVTYTNTSDNTELKEIFDTVLFAIGRDANTGRIDFKNTGAEMTAKGKIISPANDEQSTVSHIYAIGDVLEGGLELTPVAIQCGLLLARRLYAGATKLMDYRNVPTTVFTALEYSSVGYSEEDARAKFGDENVDVYWSRYGQLEGACVERETVPFQRSFVYTSSASLYHNRWERQNGRPTETHDPEQDRGAIEENTRKMLKQACLAKLVVDRTQEENILGIHYVGPESGEVIQGFAIGMQVGVNKGHFDNMVGIHPTMAEEFTILTAKKSTGEDYMKKGGC